MEGQITSVADYLGRVKSHAGLSGNVGSIEDSCVFRGQPLDSPLKPKILRLSPALALLEAEQKMFAEFKRANPLLIDSYRAIDEWDYLTLGQYFGLPTRLLDWSDNALTALWFATASETVSRDRKEPAVVWMLTVHSDEFIDSETNLRPFDLKKTLFYRPRIIRQRINNQSGVFSVHASDALTRGLSLFDMETYAQRLVKLTIPRNCINPIRNELHLLGVHAFSIFPELEGLCDYLEWKFFHTRVTPD